MDLIEYEDYGNCSLVKACKMVIEKFKLINNTYANITYAEREETNKFDEKLVREAIINAFVHNEWVTENPPKYILKLIGENSAITILEIASELCIGRTTVKRNIKELMENKMITRTGSNRNGKWLIL